jgi:hypothetical protein
MTKHSRKKYTVVGYYEDNANIFVDHVTATTPENAIIEMARLRANDIYGANIVSVFAGHLIDLNESQSVAWIGDFDGVNI